MKSANIRNSMYQTENVKMALINIKFITYWISRNLSFSHESFSGGLQIPLQQIIVYIDIEPTKEREEIQTKAAVRPEHDDSTKTKNVHRYCNVRTSYRLPNCPVPYSARIRHNKNAAPLLSQNWSLDQIKSTKKTLKPARDNKQSDLGPHYGSRPRT